MTPYFKTLGAVLLFLALLIFALSRAHAATPVKPPIPVEQATELPAPVMWFGTEYCGDIVVWMVFTDGSVRRADKDHRPQDWEGFLKAINSIPHATNSFECPYHTQS